MARTKGSLGKKTIEKLKAEGKWDYDNNCPLNSSNSSQASSSLINLISNPPVITEKIMPDLISFKHEDTFTAKIKNDSTIDFVNVDSNENLNEKEIVTEKEIITEDNIIEQSTQPENSPSTTESPNKSNTKINNKSNNKINKYNSCDRCGATIYCEPRRVDSNLLIGLADYHRNTPRYINLCDKCCHELNSIFEDWLTNKDKGGNEDLKRYG